MILFLINNQNHIDLMNNFGILFLCREEDHISEVL
jgi:hypothetical protein